MNYSSKTYALAFYEVASSSKNNANLEKYIKNFLLLIKNNRDRKKIKDIIFNIEGLAVKKTGGRKLLIETARPLSSVNEKLIKSLAKSTDIVEIKINNDLVAGIKININDELLLDGSFATKIKKILNY